MTEKTEMTEKTVMADMTEKTDKAEKTELAEKAEKQQALQKTALADALKALMEEYIVYAPTGEAERQSFRRIDAGGVSDVNLDGLPLLPPKELLFPRSETLYSVDLDSAEVSQPVQAGNAVLFGVRPCDARSIVNLDCAFLEKGYTDSAYADRREKLTVVALACDVIPARTCFCDSMGGGPADAEGADILLSETKDVNAWLVSALTEKGRAIEELWLRSSLLLAAGKNTAAKSPACTLKVETSADLAASLKAAFEDPAWASFSEACIGCGTCSYICPTCYCFDIDMDVRGSEANEFRCWDCCMFSDYSRMAGGHNPRPTKKERLRNRYLHKLSYFEERYGRMLCVGCGRCIAKCPAGLDIASVIEWGGKP